MTKQNQIRDGIEKELLKSYGTSAHQGKVSSLEMFVTGQILKYLNSKDIAIKVDGELPSVFDSNEEVISALEYKKKLTGYTLTMPLIKEG